MSQASAVTSGVLVGIGMVYVIDIELSWAI